MAGLEDLLSYKTVDAKNGGAREQTMHEALLDVVTPGGSTTPILPFLSMAIPSNSKILVNLGFRDVHLASE